MTVRQLAGVKRALEVLPGYLGGVEEVRWRSELEEEAWLVPGVPGANGCW